MEYLQSIGAQTVIFFRTAGFGFLLGSAYDLSRFVRLLTSSRRIAVWDICFGAFAGVAAFLFALTQTGGKIRVFFLAALGIGFAVWYVCVGTPLRTVTDAVLRVGRRTASVVRRPFALLAERLADRRNRLCKSVKKSVKKLQKKRKSS